MRLLVQQALGSSRLPFFMYDFLPFVPTPRGPEINATGALKINFGLRSPFNTQPSHHLRHLAANNTELSPRVQIRLSTVPMAPSVNLRVRSILMCATKWFLLAGYLWDWLLALVMIIINFTIPGEVSGGGGVVVGAFV